MRNRLVQARLALAWERLWPVLVPPLGIAGLFLALALLDVLPLLPPWLHAVLLLLFATAFGLALWRGLKGFRLPDEARARRRLERDSGLAHHPLEALSDRLAAGQGDPITRVMWESHRRRMAAALRDLRVELPAPGMAARDPLGLRAAVLLLLAIAVAGAWQHDMGERLARAVTPDLSGPTDAQVTAQVWLTPPAYTGLAPVMLEAPGQEPPSTPVVPAGTRLLGLVQGAAGEAKLLVDDTAIPFAALGDDSHRIEADLNHGRRIAVRLGRHTIAEWSVSIVQDAAPSIAFAAPPAADPRGRLRLDYEAADDYGVVKAWASVRRVGDDKGEPLVLDLPLPGGRAANPRQAGWHDLTAHPWAGLPVTIAPAAEDDLGQQGMGEAVATILPERQFNHPVARAIITQRKLLAAEPDRRFDVMRGLDEISVRPQAFDHDLVVFLALRQARARLLHDRAPEAVAGVLDTLWQTALRVEEGTRPMAERALEQAAQELEKALEQGASAEEIERLMNELQQAMEAFLDSMIEQAMEQGMQPMPFDPAAEMVTPEELAGMLEQMREMARTGARDAARQMLSDLQNMLQNMRSMQMAQPSAQDMQAQQALDDLGQLTRRQRELMDRSFQMAQRNQGQGAQPPGQQGQQGQQGQEGRQGEGDAEQARQGAAEQEALRRALGDILRRLGEGLGEIPGGLGEAEQAMRQATEELMGNMPGAAAESQAQALQHLQQGAQAAMQALAQQMGAGQGGMMSSPYGRGGRDPLGRQRRGHGGLDDNSVEIPEEAELHRAREILDELRRRAGEMGRPEPERDYLRRLLRQF